MLKFGRQADITAGSRTDRPDTRAQSGEIASVRAGARRERHARMLQRRCHPVEVEPSFRAVIDAAPSIAELSRLLSNDRGELLRALAIAGGDLVHGFASPPDSMQRRAAHHRAWSRLRELEREILAARLGHRVPARLLARAQRAIDRADVLVSALPGVLPA